MTSPLNETRGPPIARIDGRVGLDEIRIVAHRVTLWVAGYLSGIAQIPLGADDTRGHGLAQAEGAADSQNHLADFCLIRIAQYGWQQVIGFYLNYGNIADLVTADDLAHEFPAVIQGHPNFIHALDYVVIGDDVAVVIDNHA